MTSLFEPLKIGRSQLTHRVVMAPVTRFRAADDHTPLPMMAEYYGKRAATPGTLLMTEATYISPAASGYANAPALYTASHITGWKAVTDAVHANKSFIYAQLWAMGRAALPEVLKSESGLDLISSSAIPIDSHSPVPRALTEEEIQALIRDYVRAAHNAIEAGFDGVEVHAANGYLIAQFLEEGSNSRTDKWGGSIENRSRFGVEVTKAVIAAVGANRVGIRITPWSTFQGMCLTDPTSQYSHFISELKKLGPAYLSLLESRVSGIDDTEATGSLDFAYDIWGNTSPVLLAGGFDGKNAAVALEALSRRGMDGAIMYGRLFTSNADLPEKIRRGSELRTYDRRTFYNAKSRIGYVDELQSLVTPIAP
ncbi:NADH:flavin oxidoreductase/NADH oxidase family protein [Stipitochalara longipes BDJ]|nr:NADH:flavin oxidoreductase/NADH oxidase family protein [Stipitochalara longipes BDJ]